MEGLSTAAGIIAVLQISDQVISACYQYYRRVKSAKKDILEVVDIVGGLKTTLENLGLLIGDPPDPQLAHLSRLDGPLKSCQSALQSISTKLALPANVNVSLVKQLTWPWKEKEVGKVLSVIEKQKTIFILALGADTLEAVLSIQDAVEGVQNTTSSIKEIVEGVQSSVDTANISQRHSQILDWIKLSDPSSNHNSARKKHEPTTGQWFLESEPFVSWIEGQITSIWIHGIPGSGKTILSSTIIDHVDTECRSDSSKKYAYFYFDFNDANKQTVNGMLRSMICQLSVPVLPPEVDTLYQQCRIHQLDQESLVETLISIFRHSDRTFLIVDALDECSERDDLLNVMTRLMHAQRVGLLATSRNERDVARSLQCVVENVTSPQEGDDIADDISLHVQRCLQQDSRLKEWPPMIRQEIQKALVHGAHGMYFPDQDRLTIRFRWVECQLAALRNCLTVKAVGSALQNLPRTLDETYERIINIPQEYRKEAHSACNYSQFPISLLRFVKWLRLLP